MSRLYDPADNSRRCYDLAIAASREQCIRRHQIKPDASKPHEVRWAIEGDVPPNKLEAIRG